MASLKVRRIDCSLPNSVRQLAALRDQINNQGAVVSPAGRKLTQAVFGEVLPPVRVVERVCEDIRTRGLPALIEYTEHFDKVKLTPKTLRVPEEEMKAAYEAAEPEFLDTVSRIRDNVLQFQIGLLTKDALLPCSEHYELQLRYRPLRRVGICIPGGAAAYPSTLLMTVCPAQAAEVDELAVVMPPTQNGAYNQDMLAVCYALGIKEVYRIGGAQGVAALAYGVDGIEPVDMIVGPGNTFVALAKRHVFGRVAIDCIAGPSEVIVAADAAAHPEYVAIDLIAQAEHSPGISILVTWHQPLLDEVEASMVKQLNLLERGNLARTSLEDFGAFILTRDMEEAIEIVNELSPEHLHIQTRDPELFAEKIDNAGAIFLGQFTPVALGDYAAGPSHVLPTGGTARFTSGLSANDFRRRTSIINFTRNGLREIAEDVVLLAKKEGLSAHAASIELRLREGGATPRPPRKAPPAKVATKARK